MNILTLDMAESSGRRVLTANGEIDLATAPMLEERLDELLRDGGVVLDLTAVSFIDSTGLRVILNAHQNAQEQAQSFPIIAVDGPVMRLFDITGVGTRLALFSSMDDALADE